MNPPLRLAYNTNGCANHDLFDAIDFIADAGYQGVALTLDHGPLHPFAPDWQGCTQQVAARLNERDLGSVIETGARFVLDPRVKHEPTLLNPAADGRARRVAFLKRAVDMAHMLHSEAVSFWAGVPQPGVEHTQAWQWLHEGVAQVLAYAQSKDVKLALEPEPGHLVDTLPQWERLRAEHPGLKLACDLGHVIVTQEMEPWEAIERYADDLGTVAIEDMRRGEHVHLPFGQGDMDIPRCLEALGAIGFEGLVCVELSRESHRAHQAIPESIAYLRQAEVTL